MKRTSFFSSTIILFIAASVFSGCLAQNGTTPTPSTAPNTTTEKSGVTSVRGTLQVQGKAAVLVSPTGNIPLESYELNFADYAGKTVSVEGKYSGDTLFVNSISE